MQNINSIDIFIFLQIIYLVQLTQSLHVEMSYKQNSLKKKFPRVQVCPSL